MIQNPNAFVQNFIDKRGILFEGVVGVNSTSQVVTLSNIKHKFAYVDFLVSEATSDTITRFNFISNDSISHGNMRNPPFKEIGGDKWSSINDRIQFKTTGRKRYIVDVSNVDGFIIYADYTSGGSTDPSPVNVKICVAFSDQEILPERFLLEEEFVPYNADKRKLIFSGIPISSIVKTVSNIKNRFLYVDINVKSQTGNPNQKLYFLSSSVNNNAPDNPSFSIAGSNVWVKTNATNTGYTFIPLDKVGIQHYIIDVSFIDTMVFYTNAVTNSADFDIWVCADNNLNYDSLYTPQNKVGLLHSGSWDFTNPAYIDYKYTGIKQKYVFLKLIVQNIGVGFVSIFKSASTDGYNGPQLVNMRTGVLANSTSTNSVTINNSFTPGVYYFYADVSCYDLFTIRLAASTTPGVDHVDASIYASFVDELPLLDNPNPDLPVNVKVSDNKYAGYSAVVTSGSVVKNELLKIKFSSGKYAVFYLNSISVGSNASRLGVGFRDVQGNSITGDRITFYNDTLSTNSFVKSLAVANAGLLPCKFDGSNNYCGYVFVDVESLNISEITSVTVANVSDAVLTFITQTSDITPFLKDVAKSLNADNNHQLSFRLKGADVSYLHPITVAFGEYWLYCVTDYLVIGKNNDSVYVPKSLLFSNETFNTSVCPATLIPVYSGTFYETKRMVCMVGGSSGTILRCDITNINDATDVNNWSAPHFWEKKNTARKIPTTDSSAEDNYHRYDTTLNSSRYNYTAVDNGLIQYQGEVRLRRLTLPAYNKNVTAIAQYDTEGRRCSLFITEDGDNFYAVYDFVNFIPISATDKAKLLDNTGISFTLCSKINTSAFSAYSSGLRLYKVERIVPSESEKEPAHKYRFTEITNFSIEKGTDTKIMLNDSYTVSHFDIIVFTGGENTDWSQLSSNISINGDSYGDSLGDNAYYARRINSSSFYIREYYGSYDTQLSCRHIHSVHDWHEGFIIGTGEEYPDSWFMHIGKSVSTRSSSIINAVWENYRFNSSENGVQRPCGIITDGKIQPSLIFGADTALMNLGNYTITGRTQSLRITSFGIYKIALEDIDDMTKAVRVCDLYEQVLGLYRLGKIVVAKLEKGGFAFSFDSGETWEYFQNPSPQAFNVNIALNGQYNGRVVIGDGYLIDYKNQD